MKIYDLFNLWIDCFSTIFLWLFIWMGAIVSLINYGEPVLATTLLLSGFAWVYREYRDNRTKRIKGARK